MEVKYGLGEPALDSNKEKLLVQPQHVVKMDLMSFPLPVQQAKIASLSPIDNMEVKCELGEPVMDPEKAKLLVQSQCVVRNQLTRQQKVTKYRRMVCMVGYVVIAMVHILNLLYMALMREDEPSNISNDPRIIMTRGMIFGYLTTYVVIIQIITSLLGLYILQELFANRKVSESLIMKRELLFASLVWPFSMLVFIVFWLIYLYDRSLIYPQYMDAIINPVSNHIMHTFIGFAAVWDVFLRKRCLPTLCDHRIYIGAMLYSMSFYIIYILMLFYVYGVWVYPMLALKDNAKNFIMFSMFAFLLLIYPMQWLLHFAIYGYPYKFKKRVKAPILGILSTFRLSAPISTRNVNMLVPEKRMYVVQQSTYKY